MKEFFQDDDRQQVSEVNTSTIILLRTIIRNAGAVWLRQHQGQERMNTRMGGGPASYIPAHTSSALAASFRI